MKKDNYSLELIVYNKITQKVDYHITSDFDSITILNAVKTFNAMLENFLLTRAIDQYVDNSNDSDTILVDFD